MSFETLHEDVARDGVVRGVFGRLFQIVGAQFAKLLYYCIDSPHQICNLFSALTALTRSADTDGN